MTRRRSDWHRLARQLALARDGSLRRRVRTAAARYAASIAERLGILDRPRACQWCRRRLRLARHHPDHGQPLAVLFLCVSCHETADAMDLGD